MLTSLMATALSFVVYITVNIIIFRKCNVQRPLLCFGVTTLVLLPLPGALYFVIENLFQTLPNPFWKALNTTLIFGFLGICYFQFYAMLEGSITIRMLGHIFQSKDHQMTFQELYRIYPFQEVLERKMGFAGQSGYIKVDLKNGQKVISLTQTGKLIGKFFNDVKVFCRWGKGG